MSGSAAVAAICFTNPVDVVKTRLQLQGEKTARTTPSNTVYRGIGQSLVHIYKTEGGAGLQRGLGAACALQFSNVSTRFGVYGIAKHVCEITPETPYRYLKSLMLAGFSGACAALVSNPFFLLKTRLQSATTSASSVVGQTAWDGNAGVVTMLRDVYKTEGFQGFYRGLPVFMPRVMAASSVQLATYDVSKAAVCSWGNWAIDAAGGLNTSWRFTAQSFLTHFSAAWITGIAVVLAMQPFDFAATRMMNDGRGLYNSSFGVLLDTARGPEGVLGIYKGVTASYFRFGPYCILVFVFMEQLRKLAA